MLGCADVAGTDATVEVTAVTVFAVPCPVSYTKKHYKKRQFTSSNYQKTTEEFRVRAYSFFNWKQRTKCIETFLLLLHHHRAHELLQRQKATTYLIRGKTGVTIFRCCFSACCYKLHILSPL